jgi:hypothetical protein
LRFSLLAATLLLAIWGGWRGVRAYLLRMPDPATATKEGIVRWMVLRDLADEPEDTRRQLVTRIEELFVEPLDVSQAATLDPHDVQRLRRNAEVLKESWFFAKIDGYYACLEALRSAYLDRQIQTVTRWAELDAGLDAAAGARYQSSDFGERLSDFFDQLDDWTNRAAPERRGRIRSVVKAGLIRWFARQDLSGEPPVSKLRLVRGLEQQLGGQLDLAGTTTGMTPAEQAVFWRNVDSLAETWFRDKAREYSAFKPAERSAFVQRQSEVVEQLAAHRQAGTTPVARQIDGWIASAPADERPRMRQFSQAMQASLAIRKLKTWLKGTLSPQAPPAGASGA